MPELSGSVGEIADALKTMVGFTKHSRLRDQVRSSIELHVLARDAKLEKTAAHLKQLAELNSASLLETATGDGREWAWGPAFLAFLVGAGFAIGFYYTVELVGSSWWGVLLAIVGGFLALLFWAVALALLLNKKKSE